MIANCPHCGKPITSMRPSKPYTGFLSPYETDVLHRYDAGTTIREIAKVLYDLGVRAATDRDQIEAISGSVRSILNRHGREMRPIVRPNAKRDDAIYKAHLAGAGFAALAATYGLSAARISTIVAREERRERWRG